MRAWAGLVVAALALAACSRAPEPPAQPAERATRMANPVGWFEIPVTDMERAIAFYEAVFDVRLERTTIDGYDMALFPLVEDGFGAPGALAKGEVYVPSRTGAILYFRVADLDAVLARAQQRGAAMLYPPKDVGEAGRVAEFEDSEGNRIALNQPPAG
jgi:predicted enzyme related to lactoylglutathione lyase